jgi:serine/threonine-protein kinase
MISKTILHYRIIKKLGQGGMGEVYLAEDTKLKRKVALKFLPGSISQDYEERTRFIREAQATAALEHQNITAVYGIEETENEIFIVMSYIEGITLKKKVKLGPLPFDEALEIAIQIARGLQKAHDNGVIHRDIKSSNIIITPAGQAKITDFGLAKFRGERTLTKPGSQIGTASYMSPEQIQGESIDHRSDLFSFGVVLYEMLTGKLPFKGEDDHAQMFSIVYDAPCPLDLPGQKLTKNLEYIVTKSLEKDKANRYRSADELLADLHSLKNNASSGLVSAVGERVTKNKEKLTQERISKSKKIPLYGVLGLMTILLLALYLLNRQNGDIDSLAVLPFVNVNADPQMEYLSDGITESLIFKLSQLPNLKVIAPSSVFRYKTQEYDPQDVSNELNVKAVITGKIIQQKEDLSISIEFVNARDNSLLWGNQYNRKLIDILKMQEEFVSEIVRKLEPNLTEKQISQITKSYTENIEVYQLYLKGRFFMSNRLKHDIHKAMKFFNQAIEKDSSYSLAYAGLSDCYSFMPFLASWTPQEAFPKAREAALKAIKMDSMLAEAYVSLAAVQHYYDWDFAKARESLRKAINLKPSLAEAYFRYGIYSGNLGGVKESIKSMRKALELDPLSRSINTNLGDVLLWARRYDEAIEQYMSALELDPNYLQTHWGLGKAYLQKGMYEEAVGVFQKSGSRELAYTHTALGQRDKALLILEESKKLSTERYVDPVYFTRIFYGLGEIDSAFQSLEQAYENRSPKLIDEIYCEPFYDGLRDDPRYKELIQKIGFEK